MHVFRKIVAVVLLPLFCALVFAFLLVITINQTLLSGSFIKTELQRVNVYDVVVDEVSRGITSQLKSAQQSEEGGNPLASLDLTPSFRTVVTPAWLQREVERNLDSLDQWLNHGKTLELTLDVSDRKPILREELDRLVEQQFSKIPRCSGTNAGSGCVPPGATLAQFREELKKSGLSIDDIVTALPDTVDLTQPQASLQPVFEKLGIPTTETPSTKISEQLERFRDSLSSARSAFLLIIIALIAFGAVELILMSYNKKALFNWLGTMFFAASVLPLLVGIGGLLGSNALVVGNIPIENLTAEQRTIVTSLIRSVVSGIATPFLIYGGMLIALGIATRVLVFSLRPAKRGVVPATSEEHRRKIQKQ